MVKLTLKYIFVALSPLLLSVKPLAHAQPYAGISTYPLMSPHFGKKNCDIVLDILEELPRPAISILWAAFGDDTTCLSRVLTYLKESEKPSFVQFHFSNEVARRRHRHDQLDFLPQFDLTSYRLQILAANPEVEAAFTERIVEIRALTEQWDAPNIEWALSLGLEARFRPQHYDKLIPIFQAAWPHQLVISSFPIHENLEQGDFLYQFDGYVDTPPGYSGCLLNGDGASIKERGSRYEGKVVSMNVVKQWVAKGIEQNCILLIWLARWQDREETYESPPLKRRFKYKAKDVALVQELLAE